MSLSPRTMGSLTVQKNINLSKIQVSGRDYGRLGFLGGPSVEAIDLLTKEACEFLELLFFGGLVFEFSFMWICFLVHHSFMTNSSQFQAQYQELRWKYGT